MLNKRIHDFGLLLGLLLQLVQLYEESVASLFKGLIGLTRLLLLFFHFIESQKCLFISLANIIEVLL